MPELDDAEIQRLADRAERGYEPHELREVKVEPVPWRNDAARIRGERRAEIARLIQAARDQLGEGEADRMLDAMGPPYAVTSGHTDEERADRVRLDLEADRG